MKIKNTNEFKTLEILVVESSETNIKEAKQYYNSLIAKGAKLKVDYIDDFMDALVAITKKNYNGIISGINVQKAFPVKTGLKQSLLKFLKKEPSYEKEGYENQVIPKCDEDNIWKNYSYKSIGKKLKKFLSKEIKKINKDYKFVTENPKKALIEYKFFPGMIDSIKKMHNKLEYWNEFAYAEPTGVAVHYVASKFNVPFVFGNKYQMNDPYTAPIHLYAKNNNIFIPTARYHKNKNPNLAYLTVNYKYAHEGLIVSMFLDKIVNNKKFSKSYLNSDYLDENLEESGVTKKEIQYMHQMLDQYT